MVARRVLPHDGGVSPRWISAVLRIVWPAALVATAHAQSEPCRIDPFGAESIADRAAVLRHGCQGERIDYGLQTLRVRPTDPAPSQAAAHIDAAATRRLGETLLATLRLNWAASGSEEADRLLRTDRSAWAAGTWWRLHPAWALQMNIGREFTQIARTRATLAGIWRPLRNGVLFAEWAGNPDGTEGQRVGLRWWLVPNRLLIEAGGQRLGDLGWADRHVRVNWGLLR
jgi:hypothetical protein